MAGSNSSLGSNLKSMFALIVIPTAILVAYLVFYLYFGHESNFDEEGHPLPGNYFGIVYKGGPVVGMLMALALIVIIFSIERFITIAKATGKGNADNFLRRVKSHLENNNIDAAIAECDKQRGSLANVVKSGLLQYKRVFNAPDMDKEQKLAAIQKEVEEATSLELPMLERNLVVISTIASTATLIGLFGTVLGMIKAFSALAAAGTPDATALSNGISEALINTALGIGGSAIAIIMYNYFTNRIDSLTYRIDEAGFSISQTFASNYHEKPATTAKANTYA